MTDLDIVPSQDEEPPIAVGHPHANQHVDSVSLLESLLARVGNILEDKAEYKFLVALREEKAQNVLDLFQALLEVTSRLPFLRRSMTVAMQRLSKNSGCLPRALEIDGVCFEKDPMNSGGHGDVYKGRHGERVVCVKVMQVKQNSSKPEFMKACAKEGLVWSQLSHPNVLPFLGFSRIGDRPCFVSPCMENGDLVSYIGRNPSVNRLRLLQDTASGLEYLHSQEIVHGDLKGRNVLVDADGHACLADFGLSSVSGLNIPYWTDQSSVGSKGGTLRWKAPESLGLRFDEHGNASLDFDLDGNIPNTVQGDIYSWACVSYELMTGNIPFFEIKWDVPFLMSMGANPDRRPQKPAAESDAWCPSRLTPGLWDSMVKCWNKHPSERPKSSDIVCELHALEVVDDRRPAARFKAFQFLSPPPLGLSLLAALRMLDDLGISQVSKL